MKRRMTSKPMTSSNTRGGPFVSGRKMDKIDGPFWLGANRLAGDFGLDANDVA